MSTNKTTNYSLHAWEPGDDFLRAEFNENFSLIDAALGTLAGDAPRQKKLRIVTGSYTGSTGSERSIVLGFRPKAVYVTAKGGEGLHGLCVEGAADANLVLTDTGFTASGVLNVQPDSDYPYSGKTVNPYRYIAIGWED